MSARLADAQGVDLVVFSEVGLTSYAIDDLLLQDALLEAAEPAVAVVPDASRELCAPSSCSAADIADFTIAVEICEDYWSTTARPSDATATAWLDDLDRSR